VTSYLLDTNHASPLVTLEHPLRSRVLPAIQQGDSFALTAVNLAETLYGIAGLPRAARSKLEWNRLQPAFRVYGVEEEDAIASTEIRLRLRQRGRQMGAIDVMLAAVALRYGLTLLTTDSDFAAVPELRQENWIKL